MLNMHEPITPADIACIVERVTHIHNRLLSTTLLWVGNVTSKFALVTRQLAVASDPNLSVHCRWQKQPRDVWKFVRHNKRVFILLYKLPNKIVHIYCTARAISANNYNHASECTIEEWLYAHLAAKWRTSSTQPAPYLQSFSPACILDSATLL